MPSRREVPSQHLLAELSSFVGREQDLDELDVVLPQVRMLTLTGPGGVGKSRLAIRLARRRGGDYPEGIFVLQLASTSETELVLPMLAATLAVREEPGQALLDTITARLNQGRFLLLLDNCEHLAGAVASLAHTLLEACPQVQILATSRESLDVPGEFQWRLTGLPGADAVVLFKERAHHPRQMHDDATITAICRLLDGLPLGVELAAAQAKVMTPAEILAGLDDRFQLLVAGSATDSRHVTLKAMLDWSYELLSDDERTVFRRLSIFPGSFDLAAAAIASDANLQPILRRLVQKSMVVSARDAQGLSRYHLLDTMRHYGRDWLLQTGERDEMEVRFIRHFARSFDTAPAQLPSHGQRAWLARAELEYENLRGVLLLARQRDPETMLGVASTLAWFWFVRGYWTEGISWTEIAIQASSEPRHARAHLLASAVSLARLVNRYSLGRAYGAESLRLREALGDEVGRAETLFELGWLALPSRQFNEAEKYFQEVLRIGAKHDAVPITTRGLFGLGQVRWRQGRMLAARRLLIRCQAFSRSLDDPRMHASVSHALGHVCLDCRQLKQARRYFRESHEAAEALGDRDLGALTLMNIALVDLAGHDAAAVQTSLETSLHVFVRLGQRLDVSVCLDGFALLAAENRNFERALRLFAAATAIRDSIKAGWSSGHSVRVKAGIDQVRKNLGSARADRAWDEGKSMTLDQAVKYAFAKAEEIPTIELSRRERMVAALVGEGMTSSEIAARLKVAERTVDSHAEHIRNKLGLHSRAQIAAWAIRELPGARTR